MVFQEDKDTMNSQWNVRRSREAVTLPDLKREPCSDKSDYNAEWEHKYCLEAKAARAPPPRLGETRARSNVPSVFVSLIFSRERACQKEKGGQDSVMSAENFWHAPERGPVFSNPKDLDPPIAKTGRSKSMPHIIIPHPIHLATVGRFAVSLFATSTRTVGV